MKMNEAIEMLRRMQEPEPYEQQITEKAFDALEMAIDALMYLSSVRPDVIRCKDCKHFHYYAVCDTGCAGP